MPQCRSRFFASASAIGLALAAAPALCAPRVAVDVAPVQSIAAAVMADIGYPDLIVPPGASPHGHALRPSEASALEAADLVIWVGPGLTPWLAGPLDALAPDAARLALETAPGVRLLEVRDGGPFEGHDHDHGHAADHGEGHGQDPDHDHEHEHAAEHDHDHAAEHGHNEAHESAALHEHANGDDHHDAEAADPHIWLHPQNAAAIAAAIAASLSEIDPENAAAYARNATDFGAEVDALSAEIAERLDPLRGTSYFVFHDAYQYFEDAFDFPAAGSIALSDAETPRAPRVAEIRARFTGEGIDCVFAEPQFEPRLIATLIEGTATRTGTLDPLGAELDPGAGLYGALMRGLAADLADCLDTQS